MNNLIMKKTIYKLGLATLFMFCLTSAHGADLTTEQALQKLKNGNERFINGHRQYPNLDKARLKLTSSKGQFPFATVIACSDSRVPVEHIFDVGVGDIFVIRVAGNVCDIDETGSIEYGVDHLKTPTLVVLGHSHCGAVTAVTRGDEVHGSIPALVDNIIPAVDKAKERYGEMFSEELLKESIELNVWQSIEDLMRNSHAVVELVKSGKLKVIGAVYDLTSGEVHWLGEHPELEELLVVHEKYNDYRHESAQEIGTKTDEDHTMVIEASVAGDLSTYRTGMIRIIFISLLIFLSLLYLFLFNKRTTLKLKVKGKIISISVILLVLMAGLGIVSYVYMNSIGHELYSIAEEDIVLSNKVTAVEAHQLEQSILIEQTLKHAYNNSLGANEKGVKIKELEAEFIDYSHKSDQEIIQAEKICKEAIKHEKKEKVRKEFQDVLQALQKIEKEHQDFEHDAESLFETITRRKLYLVSELEEKIEKEESHLNYEIDSLLQVINRYTAESTIKAEAHEKEALGAIVVLLVISFAIGLILSITISSLITKPIIKTVELATKIADGDLSQSIVSQQDDEIGEMMDALSRMVSKLKQIVAEIMAGSENIATASQQISSSSQQMSQGANEQASSVEEISSTMEQITANIEQNSENAAQTEKMADTAQQGIEAVSKQSQDTVNANKQISEKINIITDIAFQTNILALNAAVEAARAGEHGKGFAVVAAEVRKLAEKSKVAADEIVGLAKSSYELAELAGKKMEDILPQVAKTTQLVQEISSASFEQNNGVGQVNSAIQQLNKVTQQNAAASEELATSAEEMSSQGEQLKDLISFFSIDGLDLTQDKFGRSKNKEQKVRTSKSLTDTKNSLEKTVMNDPIPDDDFENY